MASMMAEVLWGFAHIDATSDTGCRQLSGLPIGTGVLQFYTLAHIGRESLSRAGGD